MEKQEESIDITVKRNVKKRLQQNLQEIRSEDHINILFVLDVTGSMDQYRDLLVNSIDLISSKLSKLDVSNAKDEKNKLELHIKFASIAYRDKKDKQRFETQQFTSNKQEFIEAIKKLKCEGGDDVCEDIKGAFQKVQEIKWTSCQKFVVLIADSPCHGLKYHKNPNWDSWQNEDMTMELKQMANQDIIFIGIFIFCMILSIGLPDKALN